MSLSYQLTTETLLTPPPCSCGEWEMEYLLHTTDTLSTRFVFVGMVREGEA